MTKGNLDSYLTRIIFMCTVSPYKSQRQNFCHSDSMEASRKERLKKIVERLPFNYNSGEWLKFNKMSGTKSLRWPSL